VRGSGFSIVVRQTQQVIDRSEDSPKRKNYHHGTYQHHGDPNGCGREMIAKESELRGGCPTVDGEVYPTD
jgi:hypothetical protein